MQKKLQKYIGFAFAAKKLVFGTDLVLASIRRRQARLVLLATDVSHRTAKQVLDKSSFLWRGRGTGRLYDGRAGPGSGQGSPCCSSGHNR